MKKIDFNKPVIQTNGNPARLLHRFSPNRLVRNCAWVITDGCGEEDALFTEENGYSDGTRLIKNAPETITFWVPVWRYPAGTYEFGQPRQSESMPDRSCTIDRKHWIGWKGPFTFELD